MRDVVTAAVVESEHLSNPTGDHNVSPSQAKNFLRYLRGNGAGLVGLSEWTPSSVGAEAAAAVEDEEVGDEDAGQPALMTVVRPRPQNTDGTRRTFNCHCLLQERRGEAGRRMLPESGVPSIVCLSSPPASPPLSLSAASFLQTFTCPARRLTAPIVTRIPQTQQVNHFLIPHFSQTDLWYGAGHSTTHKPTVQQSPVGNDTRSVKPVEHFT